MKAETLVRSSHIPVPRGSFSRRVALRRLGGGLAAVSIAGTGFRTAPAAAQEGTPVALPPFLEEWVAAWSSGDTPRVAALYAEDAVLEDVATGASYHGPDEIAAHAAELATGLPDGAYDPSNGFIADDSAAIEFTYAGTYTGQLPGLPTGAGQAVSLRGATLFELANGKIRREAHYYDAYGFLIQLGVLPTPGAAATPEAS
ncbi:MAG: nuclear transport factor 2 family protein [Thermomicrobiales bacterium]